MTEAVKTLPVFQTVGDAIKYTVRNISLMVQLVWFWGVLIAVISTGVYLLGGGEILKVVFLGVVAPDADWSGGDFIYFAVVFLLYIFASFSVAVGWHRALLLDERPGAVHSSLGKREFSYFLRTLAMILIFSILIGLFGGIIGAIAAIAGQAPQPGGAMAVIGVVVGIAAFVGIFAVMLLVARLALVLPGAAVGDRRVSFRASFALTKGNSWRIFVGFCLLALFQVFVVIALAFIVMLVAGGDMQGWTAFFTQASETGEVVPGFILFSVFQFLFSLVFTFFALSFMSYCYWFFVPPPAQGDLAQ